MKRFLCLSLELTYKLNLNGEGGKTDDCERQQRRKDACVNAYGGTSSERIRLPVVGGEEKCYAFFVRSLQKIDILQMRDFREGGRKVGRKTPKGSKAISGILLEATQA